MKRKARKSKASKLVHGWTADDRQLAMLKLEHWETGLISLGKYWKDEFHARVKQRFSSHEDFPGGGTSILDLTRDELYAQSEARICTERLRDRIAHLREKVQNLFEICCGILEKRGQGKTPDVLRRIRDVSILSLLRSERSAIWKEFEEYFPAGLRTALKSRKTSLDGDISNLQNEWRRKINEEVRQVVRAAKIERLKSRMSAQLQPTPISNGDKKHGDDRRAAVDAYIKEVHSKNGKRITRTDIWKAARYKSRTEFERWQRNDRRATKTANERFTKLLSEKPHLK